MLFFFWVSHLLAQDTPALTVGDFIAEPNMYDAEVSPNGRYLALLVKFGKTGRRVDIRDMDKPGMPVIGSLGDKIILPKAIDWANNERLIVHLRVPGGFNHVARRAEYKEDFDIWEYGSYSRSISVNLQAKDPIVLMEDKRKFRDDHGLSTISNFLPNDNEHVLMPAFGGIELYKVNLYTGKSERVLKGSKRTFHIITDVNGKPVYRLDYYYYAKIIKAFRFNNDDWDFLYEYDLNQEENERVNSEGLLGFFSLGEKAELIFKKRNKTTGYYEIVSLDPATNKQTVMVSLPNQSVQGIIYSGTSMKYKGYFIEKDLNYWFFQDKEKQKQRDNIAAKIGDYNFRYPRKGDNKKRYIVYSYGQDRPKTYHLYDVEKNRLSTIGEYSKRITQNNLSLPARAFYKTRDGLKIRAYVLFPPGYDPKKKYPLVVHPHGGPHSRDRANFDKRAQFISTRGYIVIQPNFRGSSGYGFEFEKAGYKQWGNLMQNDLDDAANYMISKGYADPEKICIVGGSYGGYAALMGAVKRSDLYSCAVSINGVTHLRDQIEYSIDESKHEEILEKRLIEKIGDPKKDKKYLDDNSPLLRAEKITIPVLIIAGEKDTIVPVDQSERMVSRMKRLKKDIDYLFLEDARHNVTYYYDDAEKVYKKLEAFLDLHLKDESIEN